MENEDQAMQLIVHAGNAKSLAMEAIKEAKKGNHSAAEKKLDECEDALSAAHIQQTDILQYSLENIDSKANMLMVHAQDHLMNAITTNDLAREFCDLYRIIHQLEITK